LLVPLLPLSLLAACPGNLSFDPGSLGGAGETGTGGGPGGATGSGGSDGAGGTTGTVPLSCSDAMTVLLNNCGSCHTNPPQLIYANLNLSTAAAQQNLVGQAAYTGASGECSGMGFILNKGTPPATGILIDKINGRQTCGASMPQSPLPLLSSTDIACLQAWANGLVNAAGPN
jgi:hypothetical protein